MQWHVVPRSRGYRLLQAGHHAADATSPPWLLSAQFYLAGKSNPIWSTFRSHPLVTLDAYPQRFSSPQTPPLLIPPQVVRKCINIDAEAACLGSGNASATVQQTLSLDMAIEQYDEAAVRNELAALYGVAPDQIELSVVAGSVALTVTITAPSTELTSTTESVNAVSSASLASSLGRAVLNVSSAQAVGPQAASCAEGYSGPYCAVCATGYFGGGEGGTCSACADAGDPTVTIAIQGGVAFAVIVLVTLLMLKFGNKALTAAASTLENVDNSAMRNGGLAEISSITIENIEDANEDGTLYETSSTSKWKGRCMKLLGKVGAFISSFGVKAKILVSLYQVLTGLGMTFNIPYPDTYTEWLSKVSAIELESERGCTARSMCTRT